MQAIILAGGFGTRLQSVTGSVAKPMALIVGRPFLAWLLEYMQSQGVSEAVLCLHHQHESIQNYFGKDFCGMKLRYCVEKKPLGTGGAIKNALSQLKPMQPVFVLNGDSLVQLDYRRMLVAHINTGRAITMTTMRMKDCSRYGQLAVEHNSITGFAPAGKGEGDISAGFYVISPELFNGFTLPKSFSFESEFLAPHAVQLQPAAYREVQYFIDIGIPGDYVRAQQEIPARLGLSLAA